MSNKENNEPTFNDPPPEMWEDPIFKEAYAKEWAKYVFQQRLNWTNNSKQSQEVFISASAEIIKDAGTNAGKSLIVLNGAAAIAILTKVSSDFDLILSLLIYSFGAGMGALVFGGTYFSQCFFVVYKLWWGYSFQFFAIISFVIGFSLFVYGGYITAISLGFEGMHTFFES